MFHPKKKQRLLTFLAEEAASQPTTRPDTYILSSSGPALVAVSSNSSLLLNPVIRHDIRMENFLVRKLKIIPWEILDLVPVQPQFNFLFIM
jgi:hypothetical protein